MEPDALRDKWDARYRHGGQPAAARVLLENRHLLPATGRALDLACGLGGNALLLAAAGLETHAWDFSSQAIGRLTAHTAGLPLYPAVRDVIAMPPAAASFDVIVVSRFLERTLCPSLAAALRPGGLLFYQTFVGDSAGRGGPKRQDYRLAENELLRLFADLTLHVYREEDGVGDTTRGWREEALLVARRRKG